jgi:hypothetical protein
VPGDARIAEVLHQVQLPGRIQPRTLKRNRSRVSTHRLST